MEKATADAKKGSSRGAATRSALLVSATQVFSTAGFDKAGVNEVVTRAGASVGSLYHHFTGKADLFIALYEEFQQRQQDRTHRAVIEARTAGESDPVRLMNWAARAYLEGCIAERDTAWLFVSGDTPPGFDSTMRDRLREWTDRNAALFRKADAPVDNALLIVVSGAMMLAVVEVMRRTDPEDARRLANEVVAVLARVERPLSEAEASGG